MLWEKLITDGHVRAARFRLVAIPFFIIGLILLYFSLPKAIEAFKSSPHLNSLRPKQADINIRLHRPVIAKLQAIPPLSITQAEFQNIAPAEELSTVTKLIVDRLNSSASLPKDLPLRQLPPEDFWSAQWPVTEISYTSTENAYAFGAVVRVTLPAAAGQRERIVARRWIAIFHRTDKTWSTATLRLPDFYTPSASEVVQPERIPVTLRSLMNIEEFRP